MGRSARPGTGGLDGTLLGLRAANFSIAPARTSLASAWVGTGNAENGNVYADDANPVDLLGQEAERYAGGGGHAEVDDHDGVVVGRLGHLEHRLADILEQFAVTRVSELKGT